MQRFKSSAAASEPASVARITNAVTRTEGRTVSLVGPVFKEGSDDLLAQNNARMMRTYVGLRKALKMWKGNKKAYRIAKITAPAREFIPKTSRA